MKSLLLLYPYSFINLFAIAFLVLPLLFILLINKTILSNISSGILTTSLKHLLIDSELILIFGIIFTGFLAALFDSLIGDKLQGKYETKSGKIIENMQVGANLVSGYKIINNNFVNLMATIIGPFLMYLVIYFMNQ